MRHNKRRRVKIVKPKLVLWSIKSINLSSEKSGKKERRHKRPILGIRAGTPLKEHYKDDKGILLTIHAKKYDKLYEIHSLKSNNYQSSLKK